MSSNLPRQATSFVGRERQIEEIRARLQDPDCRLLTLVGPGGIGKTRLAVAMAGSCELRVIYTPLQSVASADLIPSAIADAAGYTLAGHEPLPVQLTDHLRDECLLLVLDNFEHLLDGTGLLLDILNEAPEVKLLLTSREALNVREEWLYAVPGLPVPPNGASPEQIASTGSVRLFVERAQQVRHGFRLADDAESVAAICRAVDGMPLAIELAASWLRTLDRATIARELQRDLDLLTTRLHNMPERHQSIRAVFDGSWQMLSEVEREVFAKLSVFRGGFTYDAAADVAGATAPTLAALVSKSLVYREDGGRYQVHELLRQYAAENLAESPEDEAETRRAHGEYYLHQLAVRQAGIYDATDREAIRQIRLEWDNVLQAWEWALDQQVMEQFDESIRAYHDLHQAESRYVEGADFFLYAARRLDAESMSRERATFLIQDLSYYGWMCLRLGRLDEADEALTRARRLHAAFELSDARSTPIRPFLPSMFVALARGEYAQATELGASLLEWAEKTGENRQIVIPLYAMASAALGQGQYARAHALAERSLQSAIAVDRVRDTMFPRIVLGEVALAEGDLESATHHFREGYKVSEQIQEPGGLAGFMAHLGDVAAVRQEWQEARRLYARSVHLFERIGDRGGIAHARLGLGVVARDTDQPDAARSHLRKALALAQDAQLTPVVLRVAEATAELLIRDDASRTLGLRTLVFVQAHPACDAQTRTRAAETLTRHDHEPHDVDAAGDSFASLEDLVSALDTELAAPAQSNIPVQALIEPLTPREREVLHLLADGRTNPQIADTLVITVGTAKSHTSRIYAKLGVSNRTEAVVRARELGLLA